MKILFINSVIGIRSTGRIVAEQAERYIEQGHEVRIAYGREGASGKFRDICYRIGSEVDVKINAIRVRVFDNEGANAYRQTKKFIEWADKYNPDILWLHNIHGYYINIKLLFEWIKSRPEMQVKWTLHDCWRFTGHCAHFSYVKCDRWKSGCYDCPQKGRYPKSIVKDNSRKNYVFKRNVFCGVKNMTIITPSEWLADLVKKSFLSEYPVQVVHNTIDQEKFVPTEGDFRKKYNISDKKIVLGVASVWDQRKGLEDFIRMAMLIKKEYVVVLVGKIKKQLKNLPENLILIERTDNVSQLAEIYTASDIFVNLTYEDTYPTVNLEALACGTSCITYNTGGSVESVLRENVIEQGNLDAVIKRIYEICTD